MNTPGPFVPIANGGALAWADVPAVPAERLAEATAAALSSGGRLVAWFGMPESTARAGVAVVAVIASDRENLLTVARSEPAVDTLPSLTPLHPEAHLFEREVWEQWGLVPAGHPRLRPVRRTSGNAPANGVFYTVGGPEIHEVAVGPVHAGVIEPGHFRFQCQGEEVLHLEVALGYQHRGIERALVGGPGRATLSQIETTAGDTSVAHATAHALVREALAGGEAPLRSQWLRAIGLELERLANHAGDLGALAGDVAFLPTQAACGKIRGDFLNLTALLCGNRFGRGLIRPGGVRYDLEPARAELLHSRLDTHLRDLAQAVSWLESSMSARARFEGVGRVSPAQAAAVGLVGMAARASGLVRDVRYDHPAGWHRFAQVPVAMWPEGDVFARTRVRILESQRSGDFLREQLRAPPEPEPLLQDPGMAAPETLALGMVEGWRGEVVHVAITGTDGRFRAYKIIDPSFHNWTGLELALRGTAISDFPICNKSFNLSYCGFDL